jgi:transposase
MVKPSTVRRPRPTARRRAERGAQAQAIGRSRGGRTTKIHAIVNARARPIAIEVTPGHLGDVRVATALISAVPAGGRLAADAAYDSDGLRRFLLERGTVPVIPNNPTRKTILSTRRPIANAISSSACSAASRIGHASPPAMTSSQPTSPPPSCSPPSGASVLIDKYTRFSASVSVEDFGDG